MESVDCQGVLDDGFGAAWVAGDRAVEDWLGGFATVHGIGDGVGLPFVGVPGAADSAGELGATALLNDVGGFVRGEFYIRFAAETDPIAGGVRECAHARVGVRGGAANLCSSGADIVAAEGTLNSVKMGQRLARACYTGSRGAVNGSSLTTGRLLVLDLFVLFFACGAFLLDLMIGVRLFFTFLATLFTFAGRKPPQSHLNWTPEFSLAPAAIFF